MEYIFSFTFIKLCIISIFSEPLGYFLLRLFTFEAKMHTLLDAFTRNGNVISWQQYARERVFCMRKRVHTATKAGAILLGMLLYLNSTKFYVHLIFCFHFVLYRFGFCYSFSVGNTKFGWITILVASYFYYTITFMYSSLMTPAVPAVMLYLTPPIETR